MQFKKTNIPLNIALSGDAEIPVYSSPFMLPPCRNFSLQLLVSLVETAPSTFCLEQSNDGKNFHELKTPAGNLIAIELKDDTPSGVINVSNLATLWLRIKAFGPAGENGLLSSAVLITN